MGTVSLEGDVVLLRIHARDPARAACFYAALFGWIVEGSAATAGLRFRTPSGLRGVFRRGEPSTAGPEIYVAVRDLDEALPRAVALGGAALVRPGPGPEGARVAQVLDPEGNRIGLWEPTGDPVGEGELIFPRDSNR